MTVDFRPNKWESYQGWANDIDRVIVIGVGGFGREIEALTRRVCRSAKVVFLDDQYPQGGTHLGRTVLGGDWSAAILGEPAVTAMVLGIGNPNLRELMVERIEKSGPHRWPVMVDPSAAILDPGTVQIGRGTTVSAHTSITTDITIGKFVLINLNCTVGHDTTIGDYTELSPDVNVSGRGRIGSKVRLGTGAVLLPGVTIGDGAVIGAGSVVTKAVPPGVVAKGVPARW